MKTENSRGGNDYWVIRLNNAGDKLWDKTYGSSGNDELIKILKASDGFYLCGISSSAAGSEKTESSRGGKDFWVIKISNTGQKLWDKTFGGSGDEVFADAVVLQDNSLLLGGSSNSGISGDKASPSKSVSTDNRDFWVVRVSATGSKIWDKTFGGAFASGTTLGNDQLKRLLITSDGGFILTGNSNSINGLDKTSAGNGSFWIVKINSSGTKVWDKTYNAPFNTFIFNTPDGGFVAQSTKAEFLESGEVVDFYHYYIVLKKLNAAGNLVWEKSFGPLTGREDGELMSSQATGLPNGISVFLQNALYPRHTVVVELDFDGVLKNNFKAAYTNFPVFLQYNSAGEIFVGSQDNQNNWEYYVDKYKPVTPQVLLDFVHGNFDFGVKATPANFKNPITKVEIYIDGVVKSKLTTSPYLYTSTISPGDHSVQAKAYTSTGEVVSSAITPWRNLKDFGYQAEDAFDDYSDPGQYAVQEEKASSLNAGSSVRLWDIGDRALFYIPTVVPGKYLLKVRLRSGLYSLTSTYSNPTAYFANGYTFTVNGAAVQFTGDPSSVSAKDPSYGGSYWGDMSAMVTFNDANFNVFDVTANKQWLGIDYFELILVETNNLLEAEEIFRISSDIGQRPIGTEQYNTLSRGSSAKIWDPGDQIYLPFYSSGGTYKIGARVRSGVWSGASYSKPTAYWPNGYTFALDNNTIVLTGDPATLTGKDASYGGSYWGTMKSSTITLAKGWHKLFVKANREWAGVDYITVERVTTSASTARLASEEMVNQNSPFPNPFDNTITLSFPKAIDGKVDITVADAFGKNHYTERRLLKNEDKADLQLKGIRPGTYILKVKSQEGEKIYRIIKN